MNVNKERKGKNVVQPATAPFVQRPAGPSLSPRCAVWVRGALAAGTAGSEHGPPTARRAARAGTGIHRCPPSFFLFSLTVSRGLDRPDSHPPSVCCVQVWPGGGERSVPVSTEGLPPWPASHTGWGGG